MSRRRAVLANIAGMGANTFIVSLQALILVPLYLRTLGPRLYGAWLGTGDILNFLQLFDLGLTNVVTQRIGAAHARGDADAVGEYFGSGVVAMTVIGALLALAALGLSFGVSRWMHLTGAEADLLIACFRLGALATFLFVANFSVLGLARGTQDTDLQNAGVVLGAIGGFVISLVLLLRGAGLWAIVAGLCTRTGVVLLVSAIYVARLRMRGQLRNVRPTRRALVEFARLSPATTLAGIGYLLTTQTEATLVAVIIGPEAVPILTLTRRAVDVASGLLNTVAYSSYAGFAHLVESPERERSLEVYAEVSSLWLSLALSAAAAYVVVNPSLVPIWAGDAVFGGRGLTILLALQMLVMGYTQVMYYLYRASGEIVDGSILQFKESLVRFGVMLLLLKFVGISGPALATLLVAAPACLIAVRRTRATLVPFARHAAPAPARAWAVRGAIAVAAAGLCLLPSHRSWPFVFGAGASICLMALALQLATDPRLARTFASVRTMVGRFAPFAAPAT